MKRPAWFHRRAGLRPVLLVAGPLFVTWLPLRLATTQYTLRQVAVEALLGDAQSRAAMVALYLNDRRNEVRDLVDSGTFQRLITRSGTGGPEAEALGTALRSFGAEHRVGNSPCYSTLVFISRNGKPHSEPVADAPPVSLTYEALRSVAQHVYIRPNYLTARLEGNVEVLLLSVAVFTGGSVQGQLLALLNPAILDDRLHDAPGFARRTVYLLSQQAEVYGPAGVPREWRAAVAALQTADPHTAVPITLAAVASRSLAAGRGLAVRAPLPASEFSLVCLEPATLVPSLSGIVRGAVLTLLGGLGLLAALGFGQHLGLWRPSAPDDQAGWQGRCFEALFDHLPEGLLVAAVDGSLRCANRAFRSRHDAAADPLPGHHTARDLLGEVVEEADHGVLNRALQGRQPWFGRMRYASQDGSARLAETAILPVTGADARALGIVALQRDITAEVQTADRLRQAQKMEAVGVLTDGIAHDFNNLLTVIVGNCNLLLGGSESLDALAHDNIKQILHACDRATAMTGRLLSFSRHRGIQLKVIDLNAAVDSIKKMLSQLIRENVDVSLVPADEPVLVKADTGQIEQVIINLAVNARDAMPRGGRLTVRVGRRSLTTRALGTNLEEGEYAVLSLEDTGHGMDEATRRRIFDPFFTTKGEKEGTGLGLTTVQDIVKEHGGEVTVQSQVGLGTVFTVWLPLFVEYRLPQSTGAEETTVSLDVDTAIEIEPAAPRRAPRPPGEVGILVLDDEESVLRMIERGLQAHGFSVFAARTDVELLVLWEEHRDEIDLLVTDMVMPGMSGIEVAARLRQDRPDLKVLNISAYTDTVIMKLGGDGSDDTLFLQKPFTPEVLVEKIEHLLTGVASA